MTLSGNPTISNIYFVDDNRVAFKDMLTIHGTFTGTVNFTFRAPYNVFEDKGQKTKVQTSQVKGNRSGALSL